MVLGTLFGFVQAHRTDLGCWGVCDSRIGDSQSVHSHTLLPTAARNVSVSWAVPTLGAPHLLLYDVHMHGIPRMGQGRWWPVPVTLPSHTHTWKGALAALLLRNGTAVTRSAAHCRSVPGSALGAGEGRDPGPGLERDPGATRREPSLWVVSRAGSPA